MMEGMYKTEFKNSKEYNFELHKNPGKEPVIVGGIKCYAVWKPIQMRANGININDPEVMKQFYKDEFGRYLQLVPDNELNPKPWWVEQEEKKKEQENK